MYNFICPKDFGPIRQIISAFTFTVIFAHLWKGGGILATVIYYILWELLFWRYAPKYNIPCRLFIIIMTVAITYHLRRRIFA